MLKVYWSDREGKSAPKNALFHTKSFFPNSPSPFSLDSEQVSHLPSPASVVVKKRHYLPSREHWLQSVRCALSKNLEKIVLARCEILELETRPDPFALTASLKKKAQGAYVFCFSENETAFIGASPERLFYKHGQTLHSEAMAGTRPRGPTEIQDTIFSQELLKSAKDLREITPIQIFLQNALAPVCLFSPIFSPISIHKTQNVQHLYSQCSSILCKDISDQDILNRIHPTPALCGTPTNQAFDLIRKLEPFERQLYGGALGWTTPEASEWIVGIRSCLIRNKTAYLYTGTGIVEGSNPEEEWEELNQKAKLYEGIFL